MTAALFLGLVVGGALLVVVVAALSRTGRRLDVLDWDPTARQSAREAAEDEELELGMAEHNARRVAQGLAPEDELELQRRLAAERRGRRRE
ncbi:hypothetical protein [Conexibacter sp. SYSU D00693]|uniref:hypothetical protein n=1 Tax=Conexibacter sp. SYSU D00693 TaxID=2812560 RepID=UPI00196B5E1A|nr:hypothetical protein [Conexibacter sp. SYSU D00693]